MLLQLVSLPASEINRPALEQKTVLVCGAGGFIGHHLAKRYKEEGYWVRGVNIKYPEFGDIFEYLEVKIDTKEE